MFFLFHLKQFLQFASSSSNLCSYSTVLASEKWKVLFYLSNGLVGYFLVLSGHWHDSFVTIHWVEEQAETEQNSLRAEKQMSTHTLVFGDILKPWWN